MKLLQIMALGLTLSSCESCEEQEWDTLPPEMQTGAGILGCYVNGKLRVAPSRYMLHVYAEYGTQTDILQVGDSVDITQGRFDISMRVNNYW